MSVLTTPGTPLRPYVPDLLTAWRPTHDDRRHMQVDGTLAFVDISGFTTLTERLARRGKVGAEEMSDLLDATFAALLAEARREGADLVKWGGDAVLLLFRGPDHAGRAARAAHDMRATLRAVGRLQTASGVVTLRMSVGIHSGAFDFYLVGDPDHHQELLVVGPEASRTAEMEQVASAGQIVISEQTAALLPPTAWRTGAAEDGRLLRARPVPAAVLLPAPRDSGADQDLARFLPPVLRQQVLSEPGDAEHRNVAVAFVQFRGTDDLARAEGHGAVADALDHVIRTVQDACRTNGVTFFETDIDRDGGKVMLVAGAPRSGGRDEERMLRTVRAIIDRPGRISVRIGVNRGPVFAGDFGPSFRRTYSIKGDAVNLAARVMGKAAPGEVLATTATLVRSQTGFATEPLEPFLVKGKAQPVSAARVGPVVGARRERRPPMPFVGRSDELHVLQDALEGALRGTGAVVEVVGGAGIGKTRTVARLLEDAPTVRVVRIACTSYDSSTPYAALRALLLSALKVDAAGAAEALHDAVRTSAPQLAPWLPLLAVPLDVQVVPTRETTELDEQFRFARLQSSVVELLTAVLATPTLLWLEDVQHMDEASASLLSALAQCVADRPWLVLATRRPADNGFQPAAPVVVRLAPLTDEQAVAFVRAAGVAVTPEARGNLVARAAGNPMFLEELVRAVARAAPAAALPESVQDLMTSQVDELPPLERTVLRYAAVLGAVADVRLLEQLLRDHLDGEELSVHLRALEELLVPADDHNVRFRHALLREVAYEGLPYRRRRDLHDQVGQLLAAAGAEPELLSLHFFHAGRFAEAWAHSRSAGQRARDKYANAEAVAFFERAIDAARRADVSSAEAAAVLEQLGEVREVAGMTLAAIEAYRRARRWAPGPLVAAELLFKEARIQQRLGHIPQSLRLLTRAMRVVEREADDKAHVVRSHLATRYSWGRQTQGRHADALRWAERAAREAEDAGDHAALAHAYNALHMAHVRAHVPPQLPYARLALSAYEELGDVRGQGFSAVNLGVEAYHAGAYDEALAFFQRAAAAFARAGDSAEEANANYNCADVLLHEERYAEAEELLAETLMTARAVGDEELVALVLRETGRTCTALGRYDEAERHLAAARERLTLLALNDDLMLLAAAEQDLRRNREGSPS